jgi:hypothetical protein
MSVQHKGHLKTTLPEIKFLNRILKIKPCWEFATFSRF